MSGISSKDMDKNNTNAPLTIRVPSRAAKGKQIELGTTMTDNLGLEEILNNRLTLENFAQRAYAKRKHNRCFGYAPPIINKNAVMMHRGGAPSSMYVNPLHITYLNYPKYGMSSICGRRREMEDAVAIQPRLTCEDQTSFSKLQLYAVYDGHGCYHVAENCSQRLHEIVKEEIQASPLIKWKEALVKSFIRMDKEVAAFDMTAPDATCHCTLRTTTDHAAGTTATVAIVTPGYVIVANAGDSRAVLSRDGQAIPLSFDHKPDRPDEQERIEAIGGKVIFWGGARVMGILATSRAIGDNYLKPFISCEPEVTITARSPEDDCLILGTDGLWDVVSNETACGIANICMQTCSEAAEISGPVEPRQPKKNSDQGCFESAAFLAKLALSRKTEDNVSVVVIDLKKEFY